MTAKRPRADESPSPTTQPSTPSADGAQADFIGDNLRRLFDDVAQEGVPDRLSSLLAKLAEEDVKAADGSDEAEGPG